MSNLINKILISVIVGLMCSMLIGCAFNNKKPQKSVEEQRAYESELQKRRAELHAKSVLAEKEKLRVAEHRKNAGNRNLEKIKSLGFPVNFTNATTRIYFLGTWAPSSPINQWLGLMLENSKIHKLEKFSYQGNPGVFVSEIGKPKMGLIFRIEEAYAYPYAIQVLGKTELVKTDQHFNFMNLMLGYTSQSDLDIPKPI